jgi:hypothetical protein
VWPETDVTCCMHFWERHSRTAKNTHSIRLRCPVGDRRVLVPVLGATLVLVADCPGGRCQRLLAEPLAWSCHHLLAQCPAQTARGRERPYGPRTSSHRLWHHVQLCVLNNTFAQFWCASCTLGFTSSLPMTDLPTSRSLDPKLRLTQLSSCCAHLLLRRMLRCPSV